MTNPETPRRIEVKTDDDRTAAVAEVTTDSGPEGTVRASLYAKSEHVRPGDRTSLVDAVMDTPEVQASERMQAAVPLGDVEIVEHLRERTDDPVLRAAGASTLLDASLPRPKPAVPPQPQPTVEDRQVTAGRPDDESQRDDEPGAGG